MPKLLWITAETGANAFVVQEAKEITLSDLEILFSFTPNTIVLISSLLAGALIITFLAPALKCSSALSLSLNRPVHSNTTSTANFFQGNSCGSLTANTG